MGWETRKRGGSYYTRSKRQDGRVVREYIGPGVLGKVVASDDELKRRLKEEKVALHKEEWQHLQEAAAFIKELEEAAEILVRAHLVAGGCHRHKGEWRRQREHDA